MYLYIFHTFNQYVSVILLTLRMSDNNRDFIERLYGLDGGILRLGLWLGTMTEIEDKGDSSKTSIKPGVGKIVCGWCVHNPQSHKNIWSKGGSGHFSRMSKSKHYLGAEKFIIVLFWPIFFFFKLGRFIFLLEIVWPIIYDFSDVTPFYV